MKFKRAVSLFSLSTLLSMPFVKAASAGIGAFDAPFTMISKLFQIRALNNRYVRIGFFKFLYFIIIFSAVNWVLNKFVFNSKGDDANGKRTSNVIAFAMAGISAWFLPDPLAEATAGFITVLFVILIPVGISIGATYFAFYKLKKTWWEHLLGAFIILVAIWLLTWFIAFI